MCKKRWWRRRMSRGKYTVTWWRIISRKSLLLLNWRQLQYRSLKCWKFSNSNEIRSFLEKPSKFGSDNFYKPCFLSFWVGNKLYRSTKCVYAIYRFIWCFRYLKRNVNDISIFISLFQAIKQWYKHKQNPYFQKTKFTFLW